MSVDYTLEPQPLGSPGGDDASGGGDPAVSWMPDAQAKACMNPECGKRFSLTVRRHHCRACGKIFCNKCSNSRLNLPSGAIVRVCEPCYVSWGRVLFQKRRERGLGGVHATGGARLMRDDSSPWDGASPRLGGRARASSEGDTEAAEASVVGSSPAATLSTPGTRASDMSSARRRSSARGGAGRGGGGSGRDTPGAGRDAAGSSGGDGAADGSGGGSGGSGGGFAHLAPSTRVARRALPVAQAAARRLPRTMAWKYPYRTGFLAVAWLMICTYASFLLVGLHILVLTAVAYSRALQLAPVALPPEGAPDAVSKARVHFSSSQSAAEDEATLLAAAPSEEPAKKAALFGLYRWLSSLANLLDWLYLVVSWREPALTRAVLAVTAASGVLCILTDPWVPVTAATLAMLVRGSALVTWLRHGVTRAVAKRKRDSRAA